MRKKYVVELTDEQREHCTQLVRSGSAPARTLMHARVLLKTDSSPGGPHWTDRQIAEAFDISTATVANIRKRFVADGFDEALTHYRDPDRDYQRKLDGRQEAHLIALACSRPPEGRTRWSLRLLADKMVELQYVDSISHVTVGRTLKKTNLNPGER